MEQATEALRLVTSGLREFQNSITLLKNPLTTIQSQDPVGRNEPSKPPLIRDATTLRLMAGAAAGAGGAMFAPPELLVAVCAAVLYCAVYCAFLATAARVAASTRQLHDVGTLVAASAVLMLSGMHCGSFIGTATQLTISACSMIAHLRWVAAGTGAGAHYSGRQPELSIEQLLWNSTIEDELRTKHREPLVCTGAVLAMLATAALVSANPVLAAIVMIEFRITVPHQLDETRVWKPDSYWRAALIEQAKVMSRLDPALVKTSGGELQAFAARFCLPQLQLPANGSRNTAGAAVWWKGCGKQASGQCDALRLVSVLGLNVPPCCRAHLTTMIEQVSSILTELQMPHWLDGATLLAACRHKSLMPWESSAKISFIPASATPTTLGPLLRALEKAGFHVFPNDAKTTLAVMWVGASPKLELMCTGAITDTQITLPRLPPNKDVLVPRGDLLPAKMHLVFGVYVGMPHDAHKYLELRYGVEWTRIKYTTLHHTFTGGQSHKARAAVDSRFLCGTSGAAAEAETSTTLPIKWRGQEYLVKVNTATGSTPQELGSHVRKAIGGELQSRTGPLILRAFCFSPGYPMDVVARNPRAFRQVEHTVIEPAGGDSTLPPSLDYKDLHKPQVVEQMLEQLHTRGWAVLKLGEDMRQRLATARTQASEFFRWENSAKATLSAKGSGPSAGWGGAVFKSERRENFTYNPYWVEKDRFGWLEKHPEWMASVMDVHKLVDSIGMEVLLAVGQKIGLTEECILQMVDPDSDEPFSHGSFLKYFMYAMGGGATPCCPEHADHSILTVSLCSEVPELAVVDKLTGEWVMVEEDADELDVIVFPGYYLSFLTCGYIHAPLHRVMHNADRDRLSILYFLRTKNKIVLDPRMVSEEFIGDCDFGCDREPKIIGDLIELVSSHISQELCMI